MWQMGKFTPLITGLRRSGAGLLKFARGVLHVGKMLGGTLWVGLKLVGQAILWLGRALMLNPIGLAITGIALAAYLIYRHCAPIKTFFTSLWNEVRAGFDGGLSGILAALLNFSPMGLFYRAFASVMNYFGIELPGTFTAFGGLLVTGLTVSATWPAPHPRPPGRPRWPADLLAQHPPAQYSRHEAATAHARIG